MSLEQKVKQLLFKSKISGYRITKDTNVAQSSIVRYRNKEKPLKNMTLGVAEQLGYYYDKIHNIKKR